MIKKPKDFHIFIKRYLTNDSVCFCGSFFFSSSFFCGKLDELMLKAIVHKIYVQEKQDAVMFRAFTLPYVCRQKTRLT